MMTNLIIYSLLCIMTSARVVKYPQKTHASYHANNYFGDNLKHPEKRQTQMFPENNDIFENFNENTAVKYKTNNERDSGLTVSNFDSMTATTNNNNNDFTGAIKQGHVEKDSEYVSTTDIRRSSLSPNGSGKLSSKTTVPELQKPNIRRKRGFRSAVADRIAHVFGKRTESSRLDSYDNLVNPRDSKPMNRIDLKYLNYKVPSKHGSVLALLQRFNSNNILTQANVASVPRRESEEILTLKTYLGQLLRLIDFLMICLETIRPMALRTRKASSHDWWFRRAHCLDLKRCHDTRTIDLNYMRKIYKNVTN